MKIIFLGTGAAEGIPALRCKCSCCSESREKGGRNIRQNASLYIEGDNGEHVLVDCPMHIKSRLNELGIDDTEITDLFITHYHEDHTNGLYFIGETQGKNGFSVNSKLNIYLPQNAYEKTSFMFNERSLCLRKIVSEKDILKTGKLEFTALNTNHLNRKPGDDNDSFGYLIKDENKVLAYMVDASKKMPESTLKKLSEYKIDCLIYDCTFNDAGSSKGHSDIEGAFNLKKNLNPDKMLITHISHRNYIHDELSEIMDRNGIITAYDGMVFEI